MLEYEVTWDEFKAKITDHIRNRKGPRLCRGQADSTWTLTTSFHRKKSGYTLPQYFGIVRELADYVGTIEKRDIDVLNDEVNGSFLAYLQHHGFPTPLLDWSQSPYIAAYFAFADVNYENPQADKVSVWVFDYLSWRGSFTQTLNYVETKQHVSIIRPKSMGNERQLVQQGTEYIFTNVDDIATHIQLNEEGKNRVFLEKYNISVKERSLAMEELEVMGINAFSLFRTTDALCAHFKEALFRRDVTGLTPSERIQLLFESVKKSNERQNR